MSRRDYEEGYEDARREMREREFGSSRRDDSSFTAAVFIKYLAIVVVVIIVAYVVLQILGAVQGAFFRCHKGRALSNLRLIGRGGWTVSLLGRSTRRGFLGPARGDPAVARHREHE